MLHTHMQMHAGKIINGDTIITSDTVLRKIYLSLWKGCVWKGVGDRTELQHFDPHSIGHNRVSFPFSWAAQPGACGPSLSGCWFSLPHLISNSSDPKLVWSPTDLSGAWGLPLLGAGFLFHILSPTSLIPNWLIGGLRAPSAGCWFSLPHLVSNSSGPQLSIGGLNAPSAGCWFSLPHFVSNWLNFLCTELYNSSTSTFFLWASQIALIQPIHGQGYTLLFLDRMHLLFTLVHFLFWQLGRVEGQYTTLIQITFTQL